MSILFFYISWKFIWNKILVAVFSSWFTIWNKYLISLCVKNKLVSSANIIRSNMFEAFFIKEIWVVLKLSHVEDHNWSSLSLFFLLFHWFKWIISYLRGSFWPMHDFCPLYHTVSIFWEEWSGLQCQKPSIGQLI